MGTIFSNAGFLETNEVVECSAQDLISEHVGHTAPKTRAQLERGLGKVLLVDDAHRLARGQYAAEAIEEFAYLLTLPRYSQKMIVILAGLTAEMDNLLAARSSLSGLFPNEVIFSNLTANDSMVLLDRELSRNRIQAPFLRDPTYPGFSKLLKLLQLLSVGPIWNNARDVKTLAEQMMTTPVNDFFKARENSIGSSSSELIRLPDLSLDQALLCTKQMIKIHKARWDNRKPDVASLLSNKKDGPSTTNSSSKTPAQHTHIHNIANATAKVTELADQTQPPENQNPPNPGNLSTREGGVSDFDWAKVVATKKAEVDLSAFEATNSTEQALQDYLLQKE